MVYEKKGIRISINECWGEIFTWNPRNCPSYGIHKRFWSNNGFYFRRWEFIIIGGEKFMWDSQNCPSFGVWRRIWMNEGCCFKRVVEMERIRWKGLPQLVYFSFTCLRSDNRVFLLHETLFFFHFFFTFEINSLVWSIYWKTFFFLLKHYLNNIYEISDGLEGVGWDDKDRLGSWPSLI